MFNVFSWIREKVAIEETARHIALKRLPIGSSSFLEATNSTLPNALLGYKHQLKELRQWAKTLPRVERRGYYCWLNFYDKELKTAMIARESSVIQDMWRRKIPAHFTDGRKAA